MLILRIRQAECALADGRLDEAFEIASDQELRQHRRGQKLTGDLARAFIKRGRENLAAARLEQALKDCNKAEKLAGGLSEIAQLRSEICSTMIANQSEQHKRIYKLDQVQKQIEQGWLSAGGRLLEDVPSDDGQAEILRRQIDAIKQQSRSAIDKAQKALNRNDLESAIDVISKVSFSLDADNEMVELVGRIRKLAVKGMTEQFNQGRLDCVHSLYYRVIPIANGNQQIKEFGFALNSCDDASALIADGKPGQAVLMLRKVTVCFPDAKWLRESIEKAQRAAGFMEDLSTGPLGLRVSGNIRDVKVSARIDEIPDELPKVSDMGTKDQPVLGSALPSKAVVQMDGVGSFLILSEKSVTFGAISSSERPMVGFMTEPNVPNITIERIDGDYFLRSSNNIDVSGKSIKEKLLVDGDVISLSARCRMKFTLPNPASSTAVIALSSARLGRADIRHIILLDRDMLIGPAMSNHIRTDDVDETITLFVQDRYLLCKAKQSVHVGSKSIGRNTPLEIDQQITIGNVSFVITEYKG